MALKEEEKPDAIDVGDTLRLQPSLVSPRRPQIAATRWPMGLSFSNEALFQPFSHQSSQDSCASTPTLLKRKASLEASSSVRPEDTPVSDLVDPDALPAPPAKRQRLDYECTRHPFHWYDDGSVIIRLKRTLFRVHSSRLAAKSPFFARLFEGEARGVLELGQGVFCPIYWVTGVRPKDFEVLLNVLDDPSEYMRGDLPLKTLASVLRATSALEYTKLFNWSSTLLASHWPDSLEAFRADPAPRGDAASTIVLARACGALGVRKRAYYELLRMECFGQDAGRLAVEDFAALVRAREGCAEVWTDAIARPPLKRTQCPHVREVSGCLSNNSPLAYATYGVSTDLLERRYRHDVVAGFDALADLPWTEGEVGQVWCKGCVEEWRGLWRERQEKVWADLDIWLGLE
ncbi:hypothetical protein K488DRAFT_89190 [Vararia minispora EC-137]|uniref:Uncharacterized protein n=1 Tax=Vararia minispora EC-137 TaxID=1314806 RepID=A0ACB8QAX2_9AGAM|nr:hypothetical protein K488DRAFT_89190 [Vararia minispora EC-137]